MLCSYYWKLFSFINSREHLDRIRRFRRWYEYTQSIAGGWYKQAVNELFKKNKLVKGRLWNSNLVILPGSLAELHLLFQESPDDPE